MQVKVVDVTVVQNAVVPIITTNTRFIKEKVCSNYKRGVLSAAPQQLRFFFPKISLSLY